MEKAKLKTRTHKNVMSRVSNQSESHFKPKYVVTRHATASSGAKPISSTVLNTSGFCDLPIALNDYIPETMSETVKRRTFVVKPKKTIKSLHPTVPPTVLKTRNARVHTNLYSRSSAPAILNVLNSGRTLNRSTENSQILKEIKDEIKAYHEKERSMKLSESLHKKFGLKLHDDSDVADKGIQVEQKDSHRGTPRETKEKKRQRNREYQRAWRQRHRDLKKKVMKEEKEAARRKRHRENQRAYYNRQKLLRESELNNELTKEKLENRKLCRIWIEPCKKPDLEEKSIANKTLNQSLCTVRFEYKNVQNLLSKKSGPVRLVPVSQFSSEKNKSTRNSAKNVEAEKNQSESLKRQNELPETGSKEIKIKKEEDELDVFCRSLALQLKSMPLDRARKCQEKLQAVISAELDQLDAPLSPKRWIQVEIPPSTSVTPPEPVIDIKVEPAELP